MSKTKTDFFQAVATETADVDVAGFGPVRLKQLSDIERFRQYDSWCRDDDGEVIKERQENLPYRLVILSAYLIEENGETGARLFDDDDLDKLAASSTNAIMGLIETAVKLNTGEPLEKK
tara:strand:+ start:116 stop:472 length:357 start_codon:yes stop_codon:yes gene_type:complete